MSRALLVRDDVYTKVLIDRIKELEAELRARPTKAQVDWVREYAARQEAKYKAVLARNEVLVRRLKGTE